MKIGFIGIGQMGRHMAGHILTAGYDLTVHDLSKESARQVLEKGAKWADTPRQVAQSCELVISSLPAPKDVEQVVYGENGLKSGWKKGDIYIDMSTDSPTTIRRIAADARVLGVTVLDAPVSGGTAGAEKGSLTIMVGGDAAIPEKVRNILSTMGTNIFHVGDAGCGNVAKLVNNLIALTINSICAEGMVLGVKAGIDPQVLQKIITLSTGDNWGIRQYPNTVFKGDFEPGFKMSLGFKDIGLALDLGKELDLPLPTGTVVRENLQRAIDAGYGEKTVNATILPLEKIAGVKVRVEK